MPKLTWNEQPIGDLDKSAPKIWIILDWSEKNNECYDAIIELRERL